MEYKNWIEELQANEKITIENITQYKPISSNEKDKVVIENNTLILTEPNWLKVLNWAKENGLWIHKIFFISNLNDFVNHVNSIIEANFLRRSSYLDKEFLQSFSNIKVSSSKTQNWERNFDIVDFFNLFLEIKRNIQESGLTNALYQDKKLFYIKPRKDTIFWQIKDESKQNFIDLVSKFISQYLCEQNSKQVEVSFECQVGRNLEFNINLV